jgi:NACHT domain
MAGTGKSTIARTIAREYYNKEHLGASFFFSRGAGDVSHAGKFFTTIAVQLAKKSPCLARYIYEAIVEHGDIASQGLHDQWVRLVLRPLSKLEAEALSSPLIIVIDALDECEGDNDVRVILQLLAMARELRTIQLRIFITSRPEIPIRHGFYQISETAHRGFVLHNISPSIVDHDIFMFLEHNLGIIRQERGLAIDWPGQETIKRLVRSAAGLFIWAATTCRLISDGRRFAGRRLSLILRGEASATASEERLNEIYITILTNSICDEYNDEEKEELYKMLKAILGTVVVLFSPLSAASLARLLYIRKEDIDGTVDDLHSILEVPEDQDHPIRLHHPSFRDFLLDKQKCRDQHFWVDEKEIHSDLAKSCLRLMSDNLKKDICDLQAPGALASKVDSNRLQQSLPAELQYACQYWVQHLQRSKARLHDYGQEHVFLQEHFLHWLEALSLMRRISQCVFAVDVLGSMVTVSDVYVV